jgi:ATP-dependent Clp protease ATP-binding subunit ClpC
MVRVDMSEYMERHTVSRLVGSPPGYVGYEEGGQLTEQVRRKPYSVVLLDEIEKAHPEVFNILLQVLEDGRLTDAHGRTVDFRNTVVIMTSNVGANLIEHSGAFGFQIAQGETDDNYQKMKDNVLEELKRTFRPEFLNRIDEVIVFHALNKEQISLIVDLMARPLYKQLDEKGIKLELSGEAKEFLAKEGFDPHFGARPLRRAVQRLIENPLSEELLKGNVSSGDTLTARLDNGRLIFEKV